MNCPHCHTRIPDGLPFDRALEGGLVYAQTCSFCGHVLGLRQHLDSDPPILPPHLSGKEGQRLLFVRWRLAGEPSRPLKPGWSSLDAA